jgi:hypothetical protein
MQPLQKTTTDASVFINKPTPVVANEPQLLLFDRHIKVSEITAPLWLIQRMETLRQMPPPTLEEVDTQLKASAEIRMRLTDRRFASSNGHETRT